MRFRRIILLWAALAAAGGAETAGAPPRLPAYRIVEEGWGDVSVKDIQSVLDRSALALWKHFPDRRLEPIVIMRGHNGPVVQYQRNLRGEIVMNLDTGGTFLCQYAYQFAHEFCHILAGFDNDWTGNLWFEETLCETASLFTLRHLAAEWRTRPPHPHWKDFAAEIEKYLADVIATRERVAADSLAAYYRKHAGELQRNPSNRSVNGAMAVVLLDSFERNPEHWESIAWLNSSPSLPGESFAEYLAKWLHAVPPRHKAFVAELRRKFGIGDSAVSR